MPKHESKGLKFIDNISKLNSYTIVTRLTLNLEFHLLLLFDSIPKGRFGSSSLQNIIIIMDQLEGEVLQAEKCYMYNQTICDQVNFEVRRKINTHITKSQIIILIYTNKQIYLYVQFYSCNKPYSIVLNVFSQPQLNYAGTHSWPYNIGQKTISHLSLMT